MVSYYIFPTWVSLCTNGSQCHMAFLFLLNRAWHGSSSTQAYSFLYAERVSMYSYRAYPEKYNTNSPIIFCAWFTSIFMIRDFSCQEGADSGTLSVFSNLTNYKVREINWFLGDWNPVTVLMTGFQNKTDNLSFFVGQLGCFIDLKINAGTKRCERVGVTPAASVINSPAKS